MKSKIKPVEILVNLPSVHMFNSEAEISSLAAAINTIIYGKSHIKFETLGTLGGQFCGLLYVKRDANSQQLHDQFMQLIENEEMGTVENAELEEVYEEPKKPHNFCYDCEAHSMLHIKGLDHCSCGDEWKNGKCWSQHDQYCECRSCGRS